VNLSTYFKAPFVAPGRRNRKVLWDRPFHRVMASLGRYEMEDWRRGMWLPKAVRLFHPRFNNQFSPGRECGGTNCGCNPAGTYVCGNCVGLEGPASFELDISGVTLKGGETCSGCSNANTVAICDYFMTFTCGFGPGEQCIYQHHSILTDRGVTFMDYDCSVTSGSPVTLSSGEWAAIASVSNVVFPGPPPCDLDSDAFYKIYTSLPDCVSISGETLASIINPGPCDYSGATCIITAV
jgi:hypothetical protein